MSTHIVQLFSFSLFPSILTFDFERYILQRPRGPWDTTWWLSWWDTSLYHEFPHGLFGVGYATSLMSHGLSVRYLMVPWVYSWSHGEIISWYHEFPHGLMVVTYPIHTLPPSLMVSWSHGEISHGTMSFLMVSRWDNFMLPWVSSWSHGCDICHPHTTPLSHGLMVSRWDISWYHEFPHGLTVR